MFRRAVTLTLMALMLAGSLAGCAEVQRGARGAGSVVGEAAAVPGEFTRGVNEGYRDDPGPNPYNR